MSNAEKQRAFKERKKSQGYIQRQVWVHKDDRHKLEQFLKDLDSQRKGHN